MKTIQKNIPAPANEIRISAFANLYSTATTMTLDYFIDTVAGRRHNPHTSTVERIRELDKSSAEYTKLKKSLPCVTISCECTPGCTHGQHGDANGAICIDIDAGDNPDVKPAEWPDVRTKLGGLDSVYLSALSVGGRGVFLIAAIRPGVDRTVIWEHLQKLFLDAFGIVIDKQCGNVNRLRTLSYDPGAVVKQPTVYFDVPKGADITPKVKSHVKRQNAVKTHTKHVGGVIPPEYQPGDIEPTRENVRILAAVNLWLRRNLMLSNYGDWKQMAGALSKVEHGEALFLALSKSGGYQPYDPQECHDLIFRIKHYTIGSFFWLCTDVYGISNDDITEEARRLLPPRRGYHQAVGDDKPLPYDLTDPAEVASWQNMLRAVSVFIDPDDIRAQLQEQDPDLLRAVGAGL